MVLLVVLEFENGSQEEELFVVLMSWHGNFRIAGVARSLLRAVWLICSKPDWVGVCAVGLGHRLSFLRYESFTLLQFTA